MVVVQLHDLVYLEVAHVDHLLKVVELVHHHVQGGTMFPELLGLAQVALDQLVQTVGVRVPVGGQGTVLADVRVHIGDQFE